MPRLRHRLSAALAAVLGLLSLRATAASSAPNTASQLIERLHLQKIPDEGAWFAPTYRSSVQLPAASLPAVYGSSRAAGSAIYALITAGDFSAMHRLKTDEIWHFYAGDPIELLLLYADGHSETRRLGAAVLDGQQPQFTVPAGTWMGARPLGHSASAYSLFGCTLAPGFDYGDYEPGYRDALQAAYPQRAATIAELTREPFRRQPAPVTAAASPAVFDDADVRAIEAAPGVRLRELIGRSGHARSHDYSVAQFSLAPGTGTGSSYNRVGEEFFLIVAGHGVVVVDEQPSPVAAGSIVVLKPNVRHSLTADAGSQLDFYAITVPAFSPEDWVHE